MARYSDFASSDEAVLVETDDFAIVYDKQNRAFRKKRWNSSTKSWTSAKAPYSAIVCKDGSTVWAENSEGKTIASGEAGVDDASVIQKAIDIVPQNGIVKLVGEFIVKPRVWSDKTSRYYSLILKSHITLEGGKLIAEGSAPFTVIGTRCHVSDEDVYDVTIRNLVIDAQTKNPYVLDVIGLSGSGDNYCYRAVAEDIKIFGGKYYGITTAKAYYTRFSNIYVEGVKRGGFYIGAYSYNIKGENLTIKDVSGDPNSEPYPEGCGLGIMDGTTNVTLSNIHTINSAYQGVYLGTSHQVEINGLIIDNTPTDSSQVSSAGICVTGTNEQVHISNFLIRTPNTSDYAVKFRTTADQYNIVFSNGHISKGYVYFEDQDYKCRHIKFDGIRFAVQNDAIVTDSDCVEGLFIENCYFGEVKRCAIKTIGSTYVFIKNNWIRATAEADNTYDVIDISGCVHAWVIDNMIIGVKAARYGVNMDSSTNIARIYRNNFFNVVNALNRVGSNLYIRQNRGYTTENSGTATFSGDGSTTDFEIGAHGLAITDPSKIVVKVSPVSSDAIAASPCVGYVDPADNTKIRVKFASAPASGADNVKIVWEAQVIS